MPTTASWGSTRVSPASGIVWLQATASWPLCRIESLAPLTAGDEGSISIGNNSNVQDNSTIQSNKSFLGEQHGPTSIGHSVTVGHSVFMDSVTIEDEALIGMGSTLLQGVKVVLLADLGPAHLLLALWSGHHWGQYDTCRRVFMDAITITDWALLGASHVEARLWTDKACCCRWRKALRSQQVLWYQLAPQYLQERSGVGIQQRN